MLDENVQRSFDNLNRKLKEICWPSLFQHIVKGTTEAPPPTRTHRRSARLIWSAGHISTTVSDAAVGSPKNVSKSGSQSTTTTTPKHKSPLTVVKSSLPASTMPWMQPYTPAEFIPNNRHHHNTFPFFIPPIFIPPISILHFSRHSLDMASIVPHLRGRIITTTAGKVVRPNKYWRHLQHSYRIFFCLFRDLGPWNCAGMAAGNRPLVVFHPRVMQWPTLTWSRNWKRLTWKSTDF